MLCVLAASGFSPNRFTNPTEKYEKLILFPFVISRINRSYFWLFIFIEIAPNYEFYKNADVRPPFTYATLIRQVSKGKTSFGWLN